MKHRLDGFRVIDFLEFFHGIGEQIVSRRPITIPPDPGRMSRNHSQFKGDTRLDSERLMASHRRVVK